VARHQPYPRLARAQMLMALDLLLT
jgi:hypothetical protein